MPNHLASSLFGLVAVLLATLGIAENYGYLAPPVLGDLSPSGFGALTVVAAIAAFGVYLMEDRGAVRRRRGD
ncbi:MAG: hypothetical protein WBF81_05990 [Thermoplasmata archaeon]